MAGPLQGIRVVEIGVWVAGPSCAGMLGDWGADVIKIEPPEGDPFRGLFASLGVEINPPFELDNRNKRSIALDLKTPDGLEAALKLVDRADVFVTNVRPGGLERLGLDYESCRQRSPRLIYCQVNGYGPVGEAANTAAYDVGAFWSRGGVAASLMADGKGEPPVQRGGMGDHMAGANGAGAVAAALYHRERTGEGQFVAVSLLRIGAYMMGWDLNTVLRSGLPIVPFDRRHSPNPIINSFRDSEGRWFWLLLLQGDRHWPDIIRAIGRPDLLDDPRFVDIPARMLNAPALVDELDPVFAERPLAEWAPIFERENVWFAPVQSLDEVAADPVAEAAGCFVEVGTDAGPVRQVATPATFSATPVEMRSWAPELGQDTEFILEELGYDWDRIIAMKETGAIP